MRPPFDSFISSLIHPDARPCIHLAGMWYAALCACIHGTNAISIFIAAIEVMTEPSASVATPIASAPSLAIALSIIVAIVFVLFIMVVTGVMTTDRAQRAAHR